MSDIAWQSNTPLSDYTTLNIGGPAKQFTIANTRDELLAAIKDAGSNSLVIGGGSDLLVSDQGTDLSVIKNNVTGITRQDLELTVQAGTPLQELVDYSLAQGLDGLQKLTGIPGTVGGAIYGNAGAYGQTISDHLVSVVAFDGGQEITLSKADCAFDYRHSNFKNTHFTILEATFTLTPGDASTLQAEAADTLEKRLKKYPPGLKCPGSFFKNLFADQLPKSILDTIPNVKDFYGKVPSWIFLERVGAKGMQRGNVAIADFHANLIYNTGHATAQDFWDLTHELAVKVKGKFNITLEPEVQFINLPPLI